MNEFIIESIQRKVKRGYFLINGEKVPAKECAKCLTPKTYSEYTSRKDSLDGVMSLCKMCNAERQREYAKANREIIRNIERNWTENNPEKRKEIVSKSRRKNALTEKARARRWQRNNKDKVNINNQRRRARVKSLPDNFNTKWADLLYKIYGGCAITGSTEDVHWDHFIPIATGVGGTVYWNMIPLDSTINKRKNANNPLKFFRSSEFNQDKLHDIIAIQAFLRGVSIEDNIDYINNAFKEEERVCVEEIKREALLRNRNIDALLTQIELESNRIEYEQGA